MQKITPCLWFDSNAEAAVQFYRSVFKDSEIMDTMHYGDAGPRPKGTVLSITFSLHDQEFMALNGGPMFTFSPAISLFVKCETQAEVDRLWEQLSEGGQKHQCAWLTDKFGVTWQIVPTVLGEMLRDKDPENSARVMKAMLQMTKIEIAELKRAYAG